MPVPLTAHSANVRPSVTRYFESKMTSARSAILLKHECQRLWGFVATIWKEFVGLTHSPGVTTKL